MDIELRIVTDTGEEITVKGKDWSKVVHTANVFLGAQTLSLDALVREVQERGKGILESPAAAVEATAGEPERTTVAKAPAKRAAARAPKEETKAPEPEKEPEAPKVEEKPAEKAKEPEAKVTDEKPPTGDWVSDGADEATDEEATAAQGGDVKLTEPTEALKKAEKIRDVIDGFLAAGVQSPDEIVKLSEKWKLKIPALSRVTNVEERVRRACEVLGL